MLFEELLRLFYSSGFQESRYQCSAIWQSYMYGDPTYLVTYKC